EGPVFKPKKKQLVVAEGKKIINTVIGSYQAFDADTGKVAEHVKYAKEYDPDNWFTIDPITAEIRLTKVPDRESVYVVNGSYVAKILAISEDLPGKTATGTISIDVEDANDNCPVLVNALQTVCENSPFINLTAVDKDSYPNGAPLKFTVLDEPTGNAKYWSIGKTDDNSAQLIPKNIWIGSHQVNILITDNQGLSCPEKQVLKLAVCACESGIAACSERHSSTSVGLGGGAVALMILACLLLLLVPLLLLLCYCGSAGKGFLTVPEDGPEGTILIHNKEGPVPEDTAIMPLAMGAIGAAGAGAAAGAGMLKGSAYAMEGMDGYEYNAKGMYSSSMYGMGGRYEEQGALITAGEMAAGGAGAGMRAIGVLGSGSGAGAGAQVSFGASGAGGSQAVLNEEFMRGYFYDKGMLCADEDMAQAAKDCILMYSQEGTESIAGSVGCCSLVESEFEDDRYLDDLGLKFKVLADICLGVNVTSDADISKYTAYEEVRQGAVVADIDLVHKEEEVEQHGYEMEGSYMSSESHVQEAQPTVRENVVTEESLVTSKYVQEPVMRGNILVTEKTYTTAPRVFLEPVHTQNVLVTERVIRPATSLHNVLEVTDAENVMLTERVRKSEKNLSTLVGVAEAPESQYLLVTERVLAPSPNVKAAVSIPDVSMGKSVIVTERHFAPISGINGNVVIPAELSAGPSVVKESVSISDGLNQGRSVYTKGGFGVEETPSSGSTVGNSTSRVTKYSKVQYTRS
ncbi:unnamed protein product, partial [Staurois parvus]